MSTTLDLLPATPAPLPVPSDPRTGTSLRILFLEPLLHRFYKAALAISGLYLEPSTQTSE